MQDINNFRVWCEHHKKYETHKMFLDQEGNLYHTISDTNKIGLIGATKAPLKTHKVEFYIKRKDKNNKPIYEGDIIKNHHGSLFYVKRDGYGEFKLKEIGGFHLYPMKNYYTVDFTNCLEIIGNTNENSELLNDN